MCSEVQEIDTSSDDIAQNCPASAGESTIDAPEDAVCPIPEKPKLTKKNSSYKKNPNSGIPLRLHAKANTKSYRAPSTTQNVPMNKNSLELNFNNNKKRLIQLHAELVEKQRPIQELYKSLQRTKKQLGDLGKNVVLEELKLASLVEDGHKLGKGECPISEEAVLTLRSSVDSILESCLKVCQQCLVQREDLVKIAKSTDSANLEIEFEEILREKNHLERTLDGVISENQKKIGVAITNWQNSLKGNVLSDEIKAKMQELEEDLSLHQRKCSESEDLIHNLTRKLDEKKGAYEKNHREQAEENAKLSEELKKEKKIAAEYLAKYRTYRGKMTDVEAKLKEAELKASEALNKLHESNVAHKKKELDLEQKRADMIKNEELLQQKFTEKQSLLQTSSEEVAELRLTNKIEKKSLENQLALQDQQLNKLKLASLSFNEKINTLEDEIQQLHSIILEKDNTIAELTLHKESIPTIECMTAENDNIQKEYQKQLCEMQETLAEKSTKIEQLKNQYEEYTQVLLMTKTEKDRAIEYANKMREVLQEAENKLHLKDHEIYQLQTQQAQSQHYSFLPDGYNDSRYMNRCQICLSNIGAQADLYGDAEVSKFHGNIASRYVSESLIGMSVKKVNKLRERLDHLKKMKLPTKSVSADSKEVHSDLRRQIETRKRLYEILQKHADQSCEDFIDLLKLTVSTTGSRTGLKPSNLHDSPKGQYSSKYHISNSYQTISQMMGSLPFGHISKHFNQTFLSDDDDNDDMY